MSSSEQPRLRDVKTSRPNSVHPDHVGPSDPHHKNYSLNLKAASSPAAYKVPKPKKIGAVQLWIRRNPRKFHFLFVTVSLSVFFSKPIYDIFIKEAKEGPRPKERKLKLSY